MRLAWHQFTKDFRRFRGLLGCWWGLLAADLWLSLWRPSMTFNPGGGFTQEVAFLWDWLVVAFLWDWLVFLLWVGALLLPAEAVLGDSPVRENGFFRTRPVPRSALAGGKALFLGLCLLAPAGASEFLHLLLAGDGLGWALRAVGERLLFLGPLVLAAAAFGGLWTSRKELTAAGTALALSLWLAFQGLYLLTMNWQKLGWISHRVDDPDASRLLLWSLAMAAGLLLVLAWAWHGAWGARRRWGSALAVGVGALLFALLPAWKLFPIRPAEPETVARLIPEDVLKLDWPAVQLMPNNPSRDDRVSLNATLYPRLPDTAGDVVVDWSSRSAELRFDVQAAVPFKGGRRPRDVFGWRPDVNNRDLRAFEQLIGPDTLFLADHNSVTRAGEVALGTALLDSSPTNTATVHATLTGRVFRWVKAAQLPLRAGEQARDPAGTWTVVGTWRIGDNFSLELRRDQLALHTSGAALFRRLKYWPASQYALVLVDRQRGVALVPRTPTWTSARKGGHTAVAYWYIFLSGDYPRWLQREAGPKIGELDLWILRREYLGNLTVSVESPRLDLGQLPVPNDETSRISDQNLTETEFRRRLAALTPPAPDSSRVVVGHYLAQVLQLVEARRLFPSADDPLVVRLAGLVPDQLALFLDALSQASHYSARLLRAAILRGVPEARAGEVVTALPGNLALADLILARGWEELARPLAPRLVEAPGALPLAAIQLLAALEDPATYPRLLAELERRPSVKIYEILRTLDGLGPPLEQALDRIWRERPRLLQPGMGSFSTAALLLRTGRREALEELLRLFHLVPESKREQLGGLTDALHEGLIFDGLERNRYPDHPALAAWLKDKQPEDFAWDPNRRRFRLKTAMQPTAQP